MGIPVRDFALFGVISDIDAYDLPLQAVGMAVNARCENGRVERGPIARRAGPLNRNPSHAFNYDDASGTTRIHVLDDQGYVSEWTTSTQVDLSPANGWIPSPSTASTTSTVLNDVLYVNREDREPWFRAKSALAPYEILSRWNSGRGGAQFDPNVRFKSLRATANVLVGINVTKNGQNFPNMVKWSDFADQNQPPRNWDVNGIIYNNGSQTQNSVSAENYLSEMKGSLVDGCKLGNNLVLYSTREAYLMEYVGGPNVFNFRRLFESGVLNINCVAEVGTFHYVFGDEDIYRHEGQGVIQNLAQGRVRKFIYRNLIRSELHRAFVVHNKALNEIMFCYTSAEQYNRFPYSSSGTNRGCNRAAVFNYAANEGQGVWYFYDLPWVTAATFGPVATGLTYATAGHLTYDTVGGSYAAQGSSQGNTLMLASGTYSPPGLSGTSTQVSAMRTYAAPDASVSAAQIDNFANGPMFVQKIKLDLDELKTGLRGYKTLMSLDIEGTIERDSLPVNVTVGASDHPSEDTTWGITQTFDSQYSRIDCNQSGRFIAFKLVYEGTQAVKISGFDLDVTLTAGR